MLEHECHQTKSVLEKSTATKKSNAREALERSTANSTYKKRRSRKKKYAEPRRKSCAPRYTVVFVEPEVSIKLCGAVIVGR